MTAIRKRLFPILLFTVGMVVVYLVATQKPKPQQQVAEPQPPLPVEVMPIARERQALSVRSQGTVIPKREIMLSAEVAGRVTQVSDTFANGAFVKAGETLLQIDPRDYEFEVTRAKARLAEAERLLATEQGAALQARREWRDLGNREANKLFLREPQLQAAQAQVESAKADVANAEVNLSRTTVTAPFDGRIREALVYQGQYLNRGASLASIYDSDAIEVRLPLSNRDVALINLPGTQQNSESSPPKVTLKGDIGGQQYEWHAKLVRSDATIDTQSRYFFAIAEVKNPFEIRDNQPQPLLVGLFVTAEIEGRVFEDIVRVPNSAVFDRNQIFTIDADNQAHQRPIDLVSRMDSYSWIKIEDNNDESIALNNHLMLFDGLRVTPQELSQSAGNNP